MDGRVVLYTDADGKHEYLVGTRSEAHEVFERADLLLNFHYAIDPGLLRLRARFDSGA